jgi:serine/threonine protein kinase
LYAFFDGIIAHLGQNRAVKKIDCGNIDEANNAMAEAHAMLKIRGSHFVECFECFLEPLELGAYVCYIVMEYCDGGDLEFQLRRAIERKITLSESQIQNWLQPILRALDKLHVEYGFVHRDVKVTWSPAF